MLKDRLAGVGKDKFAGMALLVVIGLEMKSPKSSSRVFVRGRLCTPYPVPFPVPFTEVAGSSVAVVEIFPTSSNKLLSNIVDDLEKSSFVSTVDTLEKFVEAILAKLRCGPVAFNGTGVGGLGTEGRGG